MNKFPRAKYPCDDCTHPQSCTYKDCQKFRLWFSCEWKIIRKAAEIIKENNNGKS
jgi:hypothetical protein